MGFLIVVVVIATVLWGGVSALEAAISKLRKTIAERQHAERELEQRRLQLKAEQATHQGILDRQAKEQQERLDAQVRQFRLEAEATESAVARFESLKQKLTDPTVTPLVLLPDVADAVGDFVKLQTDVIAHALETKAYRARKAAEEVRALSQRLRATTRDSLLARYKVALYEREAPWLLDVLEGEYPTGDEVEGADSEDDPSRHFLSATEYAALSSGERNQLALDRYWRGHKSSWRIGRDYERYIGYLWERKGYAVQYHGIEEGLQDLGRDLLARRGDELVVIQCKHWATFRTVRERHVYQLFATALQLALAERMPKPGATQLALFPELLAASQTRPLLITSTTLSPKAKEVAAALNVGVEESIPMESYSCIKCNVSRTTGERIYHLPFDQQYDNVLIEPSRGERYVATCAEAEKLGFRRAFGGVASQPLQHPARRLRSNR